MKKTHSTDTGFAIIEILILIVAIIIILLIGKHFLYVRHSSTSTQSLPAYSNSGTFNYGFNFTDQGPDQSNQDSQAKLNNPQAVASALKVLNTFSGSIMDQSMYSFGAVTNPEPNLGSYNTSSISPRLQIIANADGIPVLTLVAAPEWMHTGCSEANMNGIEDVNSISKNGVKTFTLPPCPSHYQDFADLCAHIAKTFPQVKQFIVWSEVRDFYNTKAKSYDAVAYTNMYNLVYKAIKAVRPDALIGGPYASLASSTTEYPGSDNSTLHGSWGWVNPSMQNVLSYWLKNNVGADFVTVDGGTEIATANGGMGDSSITDPLTSSQKYAVVDSWIKTQSNLPIWWMESHIQPKSGWTDQQAAAARIATLALMSASGASVGMQWQPQEQTTWADQGLWTSTEIIGGGQPTTLGKLLPSALNIIRQPTTLITGQPTGVLAATSKAGTLLVNTKNNNETAVLPTGHISLSPGEVKIL